MPLSSRLPPKATAGQRLAWLTPQPPEKRPFHAADNLRLSVTQFCGNDNIIYSSPGSSKPFTGGPSRLSNRANIQALRKYFGELIWGDVTPRQAMENSLHLVLLPAQFMTGTVRAVVCAPSLGGGAHPCHKSAFVWNCYCGPLNIHKDMLPCLSNPASLPILNKMGRE